MIDKVSKTELQIFEKIGTENVYTLLTYDIGEISFLAREIAYTGLMLPLFFIIFLRMVSLSFINAILSVLFLFFLSIMFVYVQSNVLKTTGDLRDNEKKLFNSITDLIDGFKELKLNKKKAKIFSIRAF